MIRAALRTKAPTHGPVVPRVMDEDSPDDPPPRLAPLHDRPRRVPPGSPPGTLLADPEAGRSVARVVGYGGDGVCEEAAIEGAEALRPWIGRHGVTQGCAVLIT
jgi:hypothetical protein